MSAEQDNHLEGDPMNQEEFLGTCSTPLGEFRLTKAGQSYHIYAGGMLLMSSRSRDSCLQLAQQTLFACNRMKAMRVLVAGLGMGYTLAGVLDHENVDRVDVVELVPALVRWNLDYFLPGRRALTDARVHLYIEDLRRFIQRCRGSYDAILLDVDNGPGWLTCAQNSWFYQIPGLQALKEITATDGVVGVWSAEEARPFFRCLARIFEEAIEARLLLPAGVDYIYMGCRREESLRKQGWVVNTKAFEVPCGT